MRRLVALVIAAAALILFSGLALASEPEAGPERLSVHAALGIEICVELPVIELPELPPLLHCPEPEPSEPPTPSPPPPSPSKPVEPTDAAPTSPAPEPSPQP